MKFSKITLLFCLLVYLSGGTAHAWNLDDHRALGKGALEKVAQDWGLDQPCDVHSLDDFLQKAAALRPTAAREFPELATFASFENRSQFANYLRINPKIDIGTFESLRHPDVLLASRTTITPLEIISYYDTDPDDGRDQDIFFKDASERLIPAYKDQKWFGGVTGPNSQAFRHMEKPAFQLFQWKATAGFPFRSLGEATRRAAIYFKLSQLAFSLSEDYWGWRFLAGGLHYIQDLHQPYHSGQVTPAILKKGARALKNWGWKQKGFIDTFAHIVANDHRFFEAYVNHPGDSAPLKQKALAAVEGKDFEEISDIQELARRARDESNRTFPDLSTSVAAIIDPIFEGPKEFYSDGDNPVLQKAAIGLTPSLGHIYQEEVLLHPSQTKPDHRAVDFLKKDAPDFPKNNQHLFQIVEDRFRAAGKATRSYVHAEITEKDKKRSSADILKELDTLLAPEAR